MNLFCFSLEGSVESLYEAVQNSIDGPAYNVPRRKSNHSCSRSCSPAVLSDDYTKWRGSGRSISMEIAQMQGTTMKMKKRRTHVSKSASDNEALADNPISNAAVWQAARSPEDLAHVTNSQDEESRKANHRAEVRGGKGSRQPGTKKKDKTLPNQAGGFEAWKPGQDWSRSLQREPSVRANGVDEEPRSAAKRGQKTGKKTGKTGKEGGKKGLNATGPISRAEQGLPFSDLPYRLDRRPYPGKASTLPAQENATPGRGIDTSFLPGGAMPTHHSHRQRLSNVAESSPVWAEATHTCRRPLTEYRLYSHDLTTPPGKEQDRTVPQVTANDESLKQDSKPQVVPRVPRSITDVELSEPNKGSPLTSSPSRLCPDVAQS